MNIKTIWIVFLAISLLSCKSQYQIAEINGTLIEVDSTFDNQSNSKMYNLVNTYKTDLDLDINVVIGN
jgi:hypothetical protein